MRHLTGKQQLLIACGLALLMAATRSPQLGGPELLHTGSWAVFFAAGVYLSSALALPALLLLAFALDAAAVGWTGIGAYCFTPAYAMLLPAYGCLWATGRRYAGHHRPAWGTLRPLVAGAAVGAVAAELFSSGGFYWLSGRFPEPTLAEFAAREARYFPAYLATMLLWLGLGALLHAGLAFARHRREPVRDAAG